MSSNGTESHFSSISSLCVSSSALSAPQALIYVAVNKTNFNSQSLKCDCRQLTVLRAADESWRTSCKLKVLHVSKYTRYSCLFTFFRTEVLYENLLDCHIIMLLDFLFLAVSNLSILNVFWYRVRMPYLVAISYIFLSLTSYVT